MDGLVSGGGGLKPGGLKSGILRYDTNCTFQLAETHPCNNIILHIHFTA